MRSLPPPFKHFFALSSDCDSLSHTDNAVEMYDLLRDRLQLPVSDSVHLDQMCLVRWLVCDTVSDQFSPSEKIFAKMCRQGPEWLNFAHRGLLDTVHGFLSSTSVRIGLPAEEPASGAVQPAVPGRAQRQFTLDDKGRQRLALRFESMPEWSEATASRYLVCRFACRDVTTQINVFVSTASSVLFSGTFVGLGTFGPESVKIPLRLEALVDVKKLGLRGKLLQMYEFRDGLRVIIDFVPGSGKGVDVFDPGLVSHRREEIEEIGRFAEEANFPATVFTSHGGGPVYRPDGFLAEAANDVRVLADIPENEIYLTPQLERLGCYYRNTYQNTSKGEVQTIDTLLRKRADWAGAPFYDFTRYLAFDPNNPERNARLFVRQSVMLSPSARETLGINLKEFKQELAAEVREATGGLVYTHIFASQLAVAGIEPEFFAKPLNVETTEELRSLRDSHFGLNGNVSGRTYIAPQSVFLKLSQVINGLKRGRCQVNRAKSFVEITSWVDDVSKARLPDAATMWRDLRLVYFPVENVDAARVLVDGTCVPHLIRLPNGEGPGGHVSVCDVATRCPALGRWVGEPGANLEPLGEGWEAAADGLSHTLQSSDASITLRPKHLSFLDFNTLGLKVACAREASVVCYVRMKSGLSFKMQARSSAQAASLVPLWSLASGASFAPQADPPFGLVEELRLDVSSNPGASVQVSLDRYRDDEIPNPGDGRYFISGRVLGGAVSDTIIGTSGIQEETVAVAPTGFFALPAKWNAMNDVEIRLRRGNGSIHAPVTGAYVLMTSNRSDIVFDLRPTA